MSKSTQIIQKKARVKKKETRSKKEIGQIQKAKLQIQV